MSYDLTVYLVSSSGSGIEAGHKAILREYLSTLSPQENTKIITTLLTLLTIEIALDYQKARIARLH